MPRLSAIIIAKNEASNIGACLDSIAFCDERIVVDGESDDGTPEIARAKGARVVTAAWHGFGAQKNLALSLAGGDWVLSIDADERVTPALAQAIEDAVGRHGVDGYEMPRRSSFLGREMRHSGWSPDFVLRLFRRGHARFTDDLVHERVICDGKIGRLAEIVAALSGPRARGCARPHGPLFDCGRRTAAPRAHRPPTSLLPRAAAASSEARRRVRVDVPTIPIHPMTTSTTSPTVARRNTSDDDGAKGAPPDLIVRQGTTINTSQP